MQVNVNMFGVREQTEIMRRVRLSLQKTGDGEVLTSRRKKFKGERYKPPHGKAIANFLRMKGKEPFDYSMQAVNKAQKLVSDSILNTVEQAKVKLIVDNSKIKHALLIAAELLAKDAVIGIEAGKMGSNPSGYRHKKDRLAAAGYAAQNHPYGILTGRFLAGIRARWRQGRQESQ